MTARPKRLRVEGMAEALRLHQCGEIIDLQGGVAVAAAWSGPPCIDSGLRSSSRELLPLPQR